MATLALWNGGALPTIEGSVIDTATEGKRPPALRVAQAVGSTAYARFDVTASTKAGHRFYFKTPPSWPSATAVIYHALTGGGTSRFRVNVAGSAQGGRIRFVAAGNTVVAESPISTLNTNTWYRVEIRIDHSSGLGQMRVSKDDSTVAEWESGTINADFGAGYDRIYIGRPIETSPTVGTMYFDDFLATDDSGTWPGSVAPYTPTASPHIAEWMGASGDDWLTEGGTVTKSATGIRIQPGVDGNAYVRWNAGGTFDSGFSLRFYAKFEGSDWADYPIKFISCAAAGGVFPWRVELSGPLTGNPGQVRILDNSGVVLASSSARVFPIGDWRRIEIKWDSSGVLMQVFNRFDQLAFKLLAQVPMVPFTALQIGHWTASPIPPVLNINALVWSSAAHESPFGKVNGVIIDPVDVSGTHVLVGGVLKAASQIQVKRGGVLKTGTISAV